tara:strand:+ start:364 stop:858 length:495 start_codon:yes stop_codon:yes gene_type:complete
MELLMKFLNNRKIFLVFVPLFVILDQITKLWALQNIFFNQNIIKVSSFLNLSPVWNKGISFGMFSNLENINFFITILTLIIISILFFWFFKTVNFIQQVALIFIISGAIGNLIDRFKYNAVVDFIDFHINNLHWPAFNFADTYITIGAFIYLFSIFTSEKLNNV